MIRITSESIYLTKYDMILFLEMQLLKCDLLLIHNYSDVVYFLDLSCIIP